MVPWCTEVDHGSERIVRSRLSGEGKDEGKSEVRVGWCKR